MNLQELLAWLDGKKTYIGAAGMAVLGVYLLLQGDYQNAVWLLSEATGVGGLRAAIAKLIAVLQAQPTTLPDVSG